MSCRACRVDAPTQRVVLRQNVGALVVRFHKTLDARLCKRCVHKYFWTMTGVTFFWGWWGIVSLIVTLYYLVHNIVQYIGCLKMPPVPKDAMVWRNEPAPMERALPPRRAGYRRDS